VRRKTEAQLCVNYIPGSHQRLRGIRNIARKGDSQCAIFLMHSQKENKARKMFNH